jgi:hypothetical protein
MVFYGAILGVAAKCISGEHNDNLLSGVMLFREDG